MAMVASADRGSAASRGDGSQTGEGSESGGGGGGGGGETTAGSVSRHQNEEGASLPSRQVAPGAGHRSGPGRVAVACVWRAGRGRREGVEAGHSRQQARSRTASAYRARKVGSQHRAGGAGRRPYAVDSSPHDGPAVHTSDTAWCPAPWHRRPSHDPAHRSRSTPNQAVPCALRTLSRRTRQRSVPCPCIGGTACPAWAAPSLLQAVADRAEVRDGKERARSEKHACRHPRCCGEVEGHDCQVAAIVLGREHEANVNEANEIDDEHEGNVKEVSEIDDEGEMKVEEVSEIEDEAGHVDGKENVFLD
mmetsp:Transcript_13679/g.41266  ORF Transcript_13679/g.41266 Transcript_13679/m.41266 type:complete len:306 (-) Transcript_13679:327-1244(-)